MEGNKKAGSPSFTSELFGSKDSPASSYSGIFNSIFAPSSKVFGREFLCSEAVEKKEDSASQAWNAKPGAPVSNSRSKEGGSQSPPKDVSSFYQEEKVQPCHLSSSIYYGGPDIYSTSKSTQSSEYSTYKDGGEDDGFASRGNWWQGMMLLRVDTQRFWQLRLLPCLLLRQGYATLPTAAARVCGSYDPIVITRGNR